MLKICITPGQVIPSALAAARLPLLSFCIESEHEQGVTGGTGGLGLLTQHALPADQLLQIDPQFKGPFPLAGLLCRTVQSTHHPDGHLLQCQFQDVPGALESELVQRIYQHQIWAVSGESIELPPAPQTPGPN